MMNVWLYKFFINRINFWKQIFTKCLEAKTKMKTEIFHTNRFPPEKDHNEFNEK